MSNKAIKYRLYPNEKQKTLFAKTFGCCRKVWNLMLNDKINHYKQTGESLKVTPAQYKRDYPYLKEVDSLALSSVQLNLNKAYKAFFENPKIGFPKFKSAKHSRRSYTTCCQHGTVAIKDGAIRLPKTGWVKAVIHRLPEDGWTLKSATVSQDRDGKYYASVLFEYESNVVNVTTSRAIGLDYKSDGLCMDDNGHIYSNHKYYRESEAKLAKAQHELSRKQKGSNNYEKQRAKVAEIYTHIANQRRDHLHKISTEIANQWDVVCVESLDMKAISQGLCLGKATMDNGYGEFLNMLAYKLLDRGKMLVKVDKHFPSSQLCHNCGSRQKLKLSERTYHCPQCGMTCDRDQNAAMNIKKEGLRLLAA